MPKIWPTQKIINVTPGDPQQNCKVVRVEFPNWDGHMHATNEATISTSMGQPVLKEQFYTVHVIDQEGVNCMDVL